MPYLLLADLLLILHALFVAFVVGALLLIVAGGWLSWSWIRNPWFRLVHLAAIAIVVLQSWAGLVCPLTTWEMALRARAGGVTYAGSFVSHWVSRLLYYEAPGWLFAVCYSAFGLLVVATWLWVRPRPFAKSRGDDDA